MIVHLLLNQSASEHYVVIPVTLGLKLWVFWPAGAGGYYINYWVGMYCGDSETLSLY